MSLSAPHVSVESIAGAGNAGAGKLSDQSSTMEEDWDRLDSASDLTHATAVQVLELGDAMLTVKGKNSWSPYLQGQQQQHGLRPTPTPTQKIGPEDGTCCLLIIYLQWWNRPICVTISLIHPVMKCGRAHW